MKKITTILFAFIIVLASCGKTDDIPDDNTGGGNPGDKTVVNYTYKISGYDMALTGLVLDNNNNAYIYVKAGSDYKLLSIGTDGKLRWSKTLPNGQYSTDGSGIMVVNDKIILSYRYDQLGCYTTTDGSEIWDVQLSNNYSELAYNNNVVYIAQTTAFKDQSELTAYDINTGSKKWTEVMTSHHESRVSINGDYICMSTSDEATYPYKEGITMFQDNGNTVTELWSFFEIADGNNPIWPRKAIFDGKGNVYYETGATDSCYVFSFNQTSGNMNWKTLMSHIYPAKTTLLYGNGKIICSYYSSQMTKESVAIIDANSGTIVKELSSIVGSISNFQMLLTGNTETLVFNNLNNQKPTIQLYNANGTLSKNIDGGFYDGVIAYALDDAKIDSHGNLVMNLDDEILSAKLNLAPIGPNSWSYSKGTNGNTNALN